MRVLLRSIRRGTTSSSSAAPTSSHQVEAEGGAVASPPVFRNSGPSVRRTGSSLRLLASKEGRSGVTLLGSKWKSYYFSAWRWLPWLVLICLWSYIGFHMQTRWVGWELESEEMVKLETINDQSSRTSLTITASSSSSLDSNNSEAVANEDLSGPKKAAAVAGEDGGTLGNMQGEVLLQKHNSSRGGRLVGPFDGIIERQVPGLLPRQRSRMCKREGLFPEFVKGKNIIVVFHELSMTGAPLAMLELASEMVRCGGKVSAVVLNKKGGLYKELLSRGVFVLRDKFSFSWKTAAKADLVIAGSAACNTWIGQYLHFNKKGSERLIWWVMENRREYFDRAKLLLGKARALVFLSETQEQLWRNWASQEALSLPSIFVHHFWPIGNKEDKESLKAERNRLDLRNKVRREMGLHSTDFLVVALSSINPGKGQLMLIQAALMVEEGIEDEGLEGLKILLGSVGSKSNKPAYLDRIYGLLDRHPRLANMVLWTPATVHVSPLYAAADAYVMNAQGIGETFGRVTIEAMAFGLPVLGTDAGGTKEILESNVTGVLHPVGKVGIPVLARHLRWLLDHPDLGIQMGERGRERASKMFREGPMYDKLARIFIDCVREQGG
ncbi:unnamed protein product [Sphagnum jensenii]|uniref:Glycosyl transferase family 1 domain-containing protein n=1 Tax=Sphagnum jensenii TaxID=128206 RepID=A0ABP0WPQ2_9BRYO